MLKCVNCGEPAVFYVNGKRVCFDKVCFNRFTGAFRELFLRKEIDEVSPDIDMSFYFECEECGHEVPKQSIPMTVQFFWPRV